MPAQPNLTLRNSRKVQTGLPTAKKRTFREMSQGAQNRLIQSLIGKEGFGLLNGEPIIKFGTNHPQRGQEGAFIMNKIRNQLLGGKSTVKVSRQGNLSGQDTGFFRQAVRPQAQRNAQHVLSQLLGR